MGFVKGIISQELEEDLQDLNEIIMKHTFLSTSRKEVYVQNNFKNDLKKHFPNKVITKKDRISVTFCGIKHLPDMALGNYGIAIELKTLTDNIDKLKKAIGEAYIFRFKYKFVFLIFVVDEYVYSKIDEDRERVKDIFDELEAIDIFSYIISEDNEQEPIFSFPE